MMLLLVGIVLLLSACSGQNLLKNGDFETMDGWHCYGFHCELTNIKHTGNHALKVSGRTQYWQGPGQDLPYLDPKKTYKISSYVKMLNDIPGEMGQYIELEVAITFTDNSKTYMSLASYPRISSKDGFVLVESIFTVPQKSIKTANLYYQGPKAGIEYIVDTASIVPIQLDTNWRKESDNYIESHRKSDIHFKVTSDAGIDKSQVNIQITQKKKAFPFGTAINMGVYNHGNTKYRDFIHKHFNWGVLENALKWDLIEPKQGAADYATPINTIKTLRNHGIKMRAHNIVWSKGKYVPTWVQSMTGSTLRQTVHQRFIDIVSKTKGLVEHWDVNNENLHGFWFQDKLNDQYFNHQMFTWAHQVDPTVKLFLNDYGVVAQASSTAPYLEQALEFKKANVHLYGLGVQCHFVEDVAPNPTVLKENLNTLAKAGLPIWVTELDVGTHDENLRADWYETILRVMYGHPSVEGVMFWGFWDQAHWRKDRGALVVGNDVTLTAAGRRVLDLFENQWMTKESRKLSTAGSQFTVRGFHGDYEVKVTYKGHTISDQTKTFTLDKTSKTINIHVHQ
ncbi:hypothetical protein SNE40_010732 [Patella caerulea]|uniref:GH10 domain-containing protein n=3 Tax=Patella caerulea TaxID=87958 RepID=A0AAN8PRY6_PATCE